MLRKHVICSTFMCHPLCITVMMRGSVDVVVFVLAHHVMMISRGCEADTAEWPASLFMPPSLMASAYAMSPA